jgi:hypothetical protein
VNHSVFSTVSAGTAGISLKICVGIRRLLRRQNTKGKLSPVSQWPYINYEPIDKLVEIDVLLEKSLPIDQSDQLINGAQQTEEPQ